MTEKEVAELRRRYRPDKSRISNIRGCYVNEKGEIIASFNQALALMPEEEAERFLALLRKTLTGTLQKNLLDIEFSTAQVVESPEHRLLSALRDSQLKNDEAVQQLFQQVIASVDMEHNYLILLAQDSYSVSQRLREEESRDNEAWEVFSYVLCCVCPVKQTKPALSYYVRENEFHSRAADWLVAPPELGFMFPAFDDRTANLYGALFYTRDSAQSHSPFIETLFGREAPMPAATQKENFGDVLEHSLAADCRYERVQAVHSRLQEMIEEHKAEGEEEPLRVDRGTVKHILAAAGAEEEQLAAFDEHYSTAFGADESLSPRNLIDTRQIELCTPEVTIKVAAGRGDLIETRRIDGTRYILVRAEDGATLNGVPIHIE